MGSICVNYRSSNLDSRSVRVIQEALREYLVAEAVELDDGDESPPRVDASGLFLQIDISNVQGPVPSSGLVKALVDAKESLGDPEGLTLFLHFPSVGRRFKLPDEAEEATSALENLQQ